MCVDRCEMDAVHMFEGLAEVNLDRCIGCGLCVTTCPSGSISLQRKAVDKNPAVPKRTRDTNIKLARLRGKLGPLKVIKMWVRSKVDRWLTTGY